MLKLNIIGCGNMGEAILEGILASGALDKKEISIYDKDKKRREHIGKKYSTRAYKSFDEIVFGPYNLLAVKPQDLPELIDQISKKGLKGEKLISIIAGVPSYYFEKKLGKIGIIRIMPNTPVLVRKGVFVISKGAYASEEDISFVRRILGSLGEVVETGEELQNVSTAVSGSGPAYFFLFCKCIIEAAASNGMDKETAKRLVAETMAGSAEVIRKSSQDIDSLIKMVASPGGTTEKALAEFNKAGLQRTVGAAIEAALRRAYELESMLNSQEKK